MPPDIWVPLLNQHGPWVLMVFYLLYRDGQKEQATREVLDKNTVVLTEMTTLLRERLPRAKE
jgi:hypothetical protein